MLFTFRCAKPDAGNPHVRFDERGGETGSRPAGLRRRRESAGHRHRKPTATALLLELMQFAQDLNEEEKRGIAEGLT